jgi:uncharacterized membrane protein
MLRNGDVAKIREELSMNKVVKSAIKSVLALTVAGSVVVSTGAMAAQKAQEKCYGIVKAGMNDCQTSAQSCAGSATKDSQKDAFIFMPKGMCSKIVGSSLKSHPDSK